MDNKLQSNIGRRLDEDHWAYEVEEGDIPSWASWPNGYECAPEAIVNTHKEDISEGLVNIETLKDELMNGSSVMDILEYGLTSEDIKDPVLAAKWKSLMDEYVKLTELIDNVEYFITNS